MKKLIVLWMTLVLTVCVTASALAQTQDEFELSCREKTAGAALVYAQGAENAAAVEMLPAGTYVQVLDVTGGWREILWMSGGVCQSGWTDAELESCMESVRDARGFVYDVHENDPDYDEIIEQMEIDGCTAK